jgi:hypothetical protein
VPVDSGLGVGAGAERQRASTTSMARAFVGALGSVGTDLRRVTAPPAPAEAGDAALPRSRPHCWMPSPREDADRALWRGRETEAN